MLHCIAVRIITKNIGNNNLYLIKSPLNIFSTHGYCIHLNNVRLQKQFKDKSLYFTHHYESANFD